MIKSKIFDEGGCEYVLAKFCEAIKAKDWGTALEYCCYSFNGNLKAIFENYNIKSIDLWVWYTPSRVKFEPTILVEIAERVIQEGKKTKTVRRVFIAKISVIKQDRKRKVAEMFGDWGVDPESFKILGIKDDVERGEGK